MQKLQCYRTSDTTAQMREHKCRSSNASPQMQGLHWWGGDAWQELKCIPSNAGPSLVGWKCIAGAEMHELKCTSSLFCFKPAGVEAHVLITERTWFWSVRDS